MELPTGEDDTDEKILHLATKRIVDDVKCEY